MSRRKDATRAALTVVALLAMFTLVSPGASLQGNFQINGITFAHADYPDPNDYITTTETVDGNRVQVTVTVENTGGTQETVTIAVTETASGQSIGSREVQVDAGQIHTETFDWVTYGYAWGPNDTPLSSRPVQAELVGRAVTVTETLVVKPRPAILVHGFNETNPGPDTGSWKAYVNNESGIGFLNDVNPNWDGYIVPGMKTGSLVTTGDGILDNAEGPMATFIDETRESTNAWHVDIIAYSMGGLIGRAYLHFDVPDAPTDGNPIVTQLVMLGTPNAGSSCALVLENYSSYYLTPEYLWYFNQLVTSTSGARITSVIGTPLLATCVVNPLNGATYSATVCNRVYDITGLEGAGDIVVSRVSAWSLEGEIEIETNDPHFNIIDAGNIEVKGIAQSRSTFDNAVLPTLALDPTEHVSLSVPITTQGESNLYQLNTDPNTLIPQKIAGEFAVTAPGDTLSLTVDVFQTPELTVLVAGEIPLTFEAVAPDGTVITGTTTNGLYHPLNISDPVTGTWTITVQNTGTVSQPMEVGVVGLVSHRDYIAAATADVSTTQLSLFPEVNQLNEVGDNICGDMNIDGYVTPADAALVTNALGTTGSQLILDADWNGRVEQDDIDIIIGLLGTVSLD